MNKCKDFLDNIILFQVTSVLLSFLFEITKSKETLRKFFCQL